MAWASLSSRLSLLPIVLAGPIVRKTTSTSVSVWIALKEAQSLELVIKSSPGLLEINRESADTKAFGNNLHIALLTVSGLNLQPNTIYHYDINFAGAATLISPGILTSGGSISSIVYGSEPLPSFMLPSDDMSKLKILHGSCRKPHGGVPGTMGRDLLQAAGILLDSTISNVDLRPQQLYLTGDQVYSDDVSDLLLFMLQDAGNSLLGWGDDNLEKLPSNPTAEALKPLHRLPLVNAAGFTSGDVAKSHLLRLAEFYSMYLFVWCDVLWPAAPEVDNFPSYQDYTGYAADDPGYNLAGELTQDKYYAKVAVLVDFKVSLINIRRLLANVPTYMIFDDHEVTDDWFLNQTWTEGVYASPDGKRIIQNALSAYAVFQGWGNKPEIFNVALSNETSLLDALVALNDHGTPATQTADWSAIESLVVPVLSGGNLTGGIDWSYSLSFNKFNVIVLNARTNRALFKGFSGLLSNDAMVTQIRNRVPQKLPQHEFALIIAPAPVFGLSLMEDFIQPIVVRFSGAPKGDYEPWSADRNKFEQFLKEISAFQRVLLLSGDVHYAFSNSIDYWYNTAPGRSKFVNLASSSLKNSSSGPPDGTGFLADVINNHIPDILLKIENDGLYVGWNAPNNPGSEYIITEYIQTTTDRFGNVDPNNTTTTQGRISVNRGSGAGVAHWHRLSAYSSNIPPGRTSTLKKHETRQWVDPRFPPDWQYKIVFSSDDRAESDRMAGTLPTLPAVTGTIGTVAKHGALATARGKHTIVGDNNIGEITFQWGINESDKKVVHKIWSKVGNNFIPFTIHIVNFGIAATTDQKPGEKGRLP